jgi:hypothetical protein
MQSMSDPYGDRAIQDAIEQLTEAVVGQEPKLDRQEVQNVLRGTVAQLVGEPGRAAELSGAVEPPPEARREAPPPGPPPDANAPA